MSKGRRDELSLYNDISRNTTDEVHAAVSDYSGGAASSFCDLEVYYPTPNSQQCSIGAAFVEWKNYAGDSGNRTRITGSSQGETGSEELIRLCEKTPPWGDPYFGINWSNREGVVFRADQLLEAMENGESAAPHSARTTGAGHVSIRKPTLDEWPSQSSGKESWYALLDRIGVDQQFIDPMEDNDE